MAMLVYQRVMGLDGSYFYLWRCNLIQHSELVKIGFGTPHIQAIPRFLLSLTYTTYHHIDTALSINYIYTMQIIFIQNLAVSKNLVTPVG